MSYAALIFAFVIPVCSMPVAPSTFAGVAELVLLGVAAGRARRERRARHVAERLAVAVLIVAARPDRELAEAHADVAGRLRRAVRALRSVEVEALHRLRLRDRSLELFRAAAS